MAKTRKTRSERRSNIKWKITIISFIMSVIMFTAFVVGLFNPPGSTTETVGVLGYAIGNIDEDGKIVQSYKSMYMKNMQSTSGLEIDLNDETSMITYRVVFYDEDKEFISTTEVLDDDYDTSLTPEEAKFFRVIITPNQVDGDDVVVTALNISKFVKQLAVTYNK